MHRRLHRDRGEHLHEVVDDDIAQRPHRIIEVAAVGDAEVLGHRDLHAVDVVAVPHRLEHRVREPQVQDLLEAHLAEVVVDPEDLRLVDVLVQVGGERTGRFEVVAERLLDDDPGVVGEAGIGEVPSPPSRTGRVGSPGRTPGPSRRPSPHRPAIGRVVGEVALHVAQPRGEACEHRLVEVFARWRRSTCGHARRAGRSSSHRRRPRRWGSRAIHVARAGRATGRSSPSPGRR